MFLHMYINTYSVLGLYSYLRAYVCIYVCKHILNKDPYSPTTLSRILLLYYMNGMKFYAWFAESFGWTKQLYSFDIQENLENQEIWNGW